MWFELAYIIVTLALIALFIWLGIKSIKRRKSIREGQDKKNFWKDT